jgi:hypothetical protein
MEKHPSPVDYSNVSVTASLILGFGRWKSQNSNPSPADYSISAAFSLPQGSLLLDGL